MNPITAILWLIYIFLLAVLLPHTAWAFRTFEPAGSPVLFLGLSSANLVSYIGALAFESAIAVLTHRLAEHIERTAKAARRLDWPRRIWLRYGNAFFAGLLVSTGVSSLANLAHAIEFGGTMKIFAAWGIPSAVYAVAFGGILPFVSLMFARVLSNISESESSEDPQLTEAKAQISDLRRASRESAQKLAEAERRAALAEERFAAAGDLMRALVSDDKCERILAARRQ